ncbi:MAG: BON domain-containing protein [Patescibacteria group bacterium]|jgi:hypothetical protein
MQRYDDYWNWGPYRGYDYPYYGGGGGYYPGPYYGGYYGAPYYDYGYMGETTDYALTDEEVRDIVRDTIDSNPYISRSDKNNIEIKVDSGVVTLEGNVRNRRSKPLAYADAFWSSGVVDVESKLKVKER